MHLTTNRFLLASMGTAVLGLAVVATVPSDAAAPPKNIFADIGVQIQEPLKKLTALDGEEKSLRSSEDAQIFASDAEKKQRARIERDIEQLKLDVAESDRIRQSIIDSGCPKNGGMAPIDVVNRCNPIVDAHTAASAKLVEWMKSLKAQRDTVNELRANVSATVLANVQKRKQIDADRAQLTAARNKLQSLAVTEVIKRNKLGAAKACKSECCHRVIYDGADPGLCGVGLVCQSFQSAGMFGTKNPICTVAASSTPVKR